MTRSSSSSEIVDRFRSLCRASPDRPLLHLPGRRSVTAADLWQDAEEQHHRLEACGITREHLVISAAGNHPSAIGLCLACRKLGAALLLADTGTTPAELAAIAQRFRATLAVARASGRLLEVGTVAPFITDLAVVRFADIEPAPELYSGAAVLRLTSGSTGLPKATFTTERQIICDSTNIIAAMGIGADACQLAAIPISHAYGFGNLVVPLFLQGTPIVLRDGFVPHQFRADAQAYDVRIFPGVPFMFDHLAAHVDETAWPAGLRYLISAGARLDPAGALAFHRRFGVKIHSFYGTSESGGIAFDDSEEIQEELSVGWPLPGIAITLRPEAGAPLDGGRIHVAGDAVASGYVGADPAEEGFTDGGFLTGDFGRFDSRGQLILTGRASSFINVAGRKVQPEEVEQVLRTMPGIGDIHVLGVPDSIRGQVVVACYVATGTDPGVLAIRRFCAARLAPHKIPRWCVPLPAIPLTARGKIDRQRLVEIALEHVRSGATGVL